MSNCGCEERWETEEYGSYGIDGMRSSRRYQLPTIYCQLHGGNNPINWQSLYGDDATIEWNKWELNKIIKQIHELEKGKTRIALQIENAKKEKVKLLEDRKAKRKQDLQRQIEETKRRRENEEKQKIIDDEKRKAKKKEELDSSIRQHQSILQKLQDEKDLLNK